MILTVTAFKGGVGKTTTAIHLAAYLNQKAPTILIDGDLNRSAMLWASHGKLSFPVVDEREGLKASRQYDHIVIDTPARPEVEEIKSLSRGCDLLLLPTTPDVLAGFRIHFDTAGLSLVSAFFYGLRGFRYDH